MEFSEITIVCSGDSKEILIAEIAELGFDSMIETEEGFQAYCTSSDYPETSLRKLQQKYQASFPFTYTTALIEKRNWNEEWEKNFKPVWIGSYLIRASFHDSDPDALMELIIDPKMSFGTGHHETTSLMVAMQFELDIQDKSVLDCGFGTGILSILANKLGAAKVTGTEIDTWCVENANENAELNGISCISFLTGTIGDMTGSELFDIILANINKNVLLNEIPTYVKKLNTNGTLLLSGFYKSDLMEIISMCEQFALKFVSSKEKNNWVAAIFRTVN